MANERRPDILEISEEKIFKTLGRGVPMCNTLNEIEASTRRSIMAVKQAIKTMPPERTEHIQGLKVIHDRQLSNLEELKKVQFGVKC